MDGTLVFDINGCLVGLLDTTYNIGWYKMIVYLHSSPSFANFSEGPTLSPKPSYSSSHFSGTSFAFFTTRYTTAGFFDTTLFIIIIFLVRVLIRTITFFKVQNFLDFDLIIIFCTLHWMARAILFINLKTSWHLSNTAWKLTP